MFAGRPQGVVAVARRLIGRLVFSPMAARIRRRRRALLAVCSGLLLAGAAWATPLTAAVAAAAPSAAGKIAFESYRDAGLSPTRAWDIFLMNPDGSGAVNLTPTDGEDRQPAFSPDATKIAFASTRDRGRHIFVMNADGSNPVRLTDDMDQDSLPTFSPDGSKIAFVRWLYRNNSEIFIMNADGSGQTRLTTPGYNGSTDPVFTPDGSKIAFTRDHDDGTSDIYLMNLDGSGQVNLSDNVGHNERGTVFSPNGTRMAFGDGYGGESNISLANADATGLTPLPSTTWYEGRPTFSGDGRRIAYETQRLEPGVLNQLEIFVMNADGSGQTNITNHAANDGDPAWAPGPPATPSAATAPGPVPAVMSLPFGPLPTSLPSLGRVTPSSCPRGTSATVRCGRDARRRLVMVGSGVAERFVGSRGRDRIFGAGGDDRIAGGAGDDELAGGAGDDRVSGGAGADRVSGDGGRDHLLGGSGTDRLRGGAGRDRLDCGRGRDRALATARDRVSRNCERRS